MVNSKSVPSRNIIVTILLMIMLVVSGVPSQSSLAQENIPPQTNPTPEVGVRQINDNDEDITRESVTLDDGTRIEFQSDNSGEEESQGIPEVTDEDLAKIVPLQNNQLPGTFQVDIISQPTIRARELLTYSIYFTNTSSTTYNNVLLVNNIGENQAYVGCNTTATCPFTFTSSTNFPKPTIDSLTGNGNNTASRRITWALGTVQPNAQGVIQYTVQVKQDIFPRTNNAARNLGNTAALYKDGSVTPVNELNSDAWGTLVVGPIFYISKVVDKADVLQGDELLYTITLGNTTQTVDRPNGSPRPDAIDATNVVIYDIIPDQLHGLQAVNENGVTGTISPDGRRITWTINRLNVGSSIELKLRATVMNEPPNCNNINNNRVFVTSNEIPVSNLTTGERYTIQAHKSATSTLYAPVKFKIVPSPNKVYIGETVTWNITIENTWSSAISGASFQYNLPAAFEYVSSTDGGVYDAINKAVTWSSIDLPARASFKSPGVKVLSVTTKAGKVINGNKGSVQVLSLPNAIPTKCVRLVDATVNVEPLLSATKSVNVEPTDEVLAGDTVIYTISLFNRSNQPIVDATFVDVLPSIVGEYFEFVGMLNNDPAPTTITPTRLTWTNISVPAGSIANPGRRDLSFAAIARGMPLRCSDNDIKELNSSISPGRDYSGARVCLATPFLVDKTVDRSVVSPLDSNGQVIFTLTFANRGTVPVEMRPVDQLFRANNVYPEFVEMVSGPNPDNTIPDSSGRIYWPIITLEPDESVEYVFKAQLPGGTTTSLLPGSYCDEAQFHPIGENYYIFSVPRTCVIVSNLRVDAAKTVDRNVAGLGEILTFTVSLTNQSDEDVKGMVISDTLPLNTEFIAPVEGSPAPTVTKLENGLYHLEWRGINLSAKGKFQAKYQVRAPSLIGTYRNTIEIIGGTPQPIMNCNNYATGCLVYRDFRIENFLSIELETDRDEMLPGDEALFTLKMVNTNTIDYKNVALAIELPLGFKFERMADANSKYGNPVQTNNILQWANLELSKRNGAQAGEITFSFYAKAQGGYGKFSSRVTATSPSGTFPPADDVAILLVVPEDPAVSYLGPTLVEVDSEVTVQISFVNPEAFALENVEIKTTLPDNFTFVEMTEGDTPTVSGQELTWTFAQVDGMNTDNMPGTINLEFVIKVPSEPTTANFEVTATTTSPTVEIDHEFSKFEMVVAKLIHMFLPAIQTAAPPTQP